MMFYRGCRVYYRLENITDTGFVVQVDHGDKRFFLNFLSVDFFETWYERLPKQDKTLNEVVTCDVRKLILDIDGDEYTDLLTMFDFERHVSARIHEVFQMLDIGVPEVIMYRMTDEEGNTCDEKLSYHAVVSNFSFPASTCVGLCMIIASGQAWDKLVDTSIYKTVQCIRMEGSTKHNEHRWKTASCNVEFSSGLISHLDNVVQSDVTCTLSPCRKKQLDSDTNVDMSQFKIGKLRGTYVPLHRIKPGYCCQCDRTHDRENAAIRYVGGKSFFVCWRSRQQRLM